MTINGFLDDITGAIVGVFFAEVGGGGEAGEAEDASSDAGPVFVFSFHDYFLVWEREMVKGYLGRLVKIF